MKGARLLVACVALCSCGTEQGDAPPQAPSSCTPPELALPDGSCIRPGIPPDGCAPGFVHDGEYGCDPILPAAPCPSGLMALAGETECRAVMACASGKWGD